MLDIDGMDKRDRADLFRSRLDEAMKREGITRSALARIAGVDRSTIAQLLGEEGDGRLPNAHLAAECAAALKVSADDAVMEVIRPGQHGSTYGGNPLACAVATVALQIVEDERLMLRARRLGEVFRARMRALVEATPLLRLVRGKGLLNAIVVNDSATSQTAWNLCVALAEAGLLAKPTHGNIIRFAPPLVICDEELDEACSIIEAVVASFPPPASALHAG